MTNPEPTNLPPHKHVWKATFHIFLHQKKGPQGRDPAWSGMEGRQGSRRDDVWDVCSRLCADVTNFSALRRNGVNKHRKTTWPLACLWGLFRFGLPWLWKSWELPKCWLQAQTGLIEDKVSVQLEKQRSVFREPKS